MPFAKTRTGAALRENTMASRLFPIMICAPTVRPAADAVRSETSARQSFFRRRKSGEAVMATFRQTAAPVSLAGRHHHGFAASVIAAAAIDGFTYYCGYTPCGENHPYHYDGGYVPESHYGYGPCQPGTIFFGEDGLRHLCE
jgi:hypothetical protein